MLPCSREDKNKFYSNLQLVLGKISREEPYILLGDFNACVGARQSLDDQWANFHDPHGFGVMMLVRSFFVIFVHERGYSM